MTNQRILPDYEIDKLCEWLKAKELFYEGLANDKGFCREYRTMFLARSLSYGDALYQVHFMLGLNDGRTMYDRR